MDDQKFFTTSKDPEDFREDIPTRIQPHDKSALIVHRSGRKAFLCHRTVPASKTFLLRAVMMLVCSLCTVVVIAQTFGTDLNGHTVDELAPPGARAIVFFFAASDCPISNRYIPEIERLDRAYEPKGVRFWWVYPNPAETPEGVRRHQQEFQIVGRVILDTDQRIARMANATITPEAAVFVPAGSELREVYRGRIDDRYLALGQERPTATRHDLEDAINALLVGQPVRPPGGPTVGCSIVPRAGQ